MYNECIDYLNRHEGFGGSKPVGGSNNALDRFVRAVKCGFDIQEAIKGENAELPKKRRMEFRIGINLGDVIQDGDRIYGDGVNVAARMESLAEAGGICLSGSAYDQIENKFAFGCEYLGEQSVKNILTPIRVYRITRDENGIACRVKSRFQKPSSRNFYAVVICLLTIFLGGLFVWTIYRPPAAESIESASVEKMAYPLPDKPSIAVLPLKNFSGNEKDSLICKGLTEDIITTLSRVPQLFVIASASSFAYEGQAVKINQVAEQLGVRFIVDGSMQRQKNRLRFNVQLVDAVAGNQLWANRFDRKVEDLFVLQDDLVRRILVELQVRLTDGDFARIMSRKTQNLDAWLLLSQGFHEGFKYTREGMARAHELFEEAREYDPNWERPLVGLSWVYWNESRLGWADNRDVWIRKGIELAKKAVEWAPEEPGGYQMLGMLAMSTEDSNRFNRAIEYREKALELAPNDYVVVWGYGSVLYKAGEPERAIEILKRALRMNPSKTIALSWTIAEAQLIAERYNDVIETSNMAIDRQPDALYPHVFLAAAYSATGQPEKAKVEATKVLSIDPKFTVTAWMKSRLLKNLSDEERYANLLLRSGLPEIPK
jgi:adenylate cyclase